MTSGGDERIERFSVRPGAPPRASQCKSTLLVSSIRALRDAGHFGSYASRLDPAWRDALLEAVAGVWLPIDAAAAHYEAADAIGLPIVEQARLGSSVADRIHRSILSTMLKLASGTGATPWAALVQFHRFYDRIFDGGATRVTELGPKDARIEITGLSLARIGYFVQAYRGLIQTGAELFAQKAVCTVLPQLTTHSTIGYRLAWA